MQAARGAAWPVLRASLGRPCPRPHELRPLEWVLRRSHREEAVEPSLPGTPVLSFGTAGCNLACRFCQNWDISKSREVNTLADAASPEWVAATALALGCRSVAFTYNDPVIFMEYAIDARAGGAAIAAWVTWHHRCGSPRRLPEPTGSAETCSRAPREAGGASGYRCCSDRKGPLVRHIRQGLLLLPESSSASPGAHECVGRGTPGPHRS